MWNLFVFALIGLLAGSAAQMWYTGRPLRIVGTLASGMIGALAGGMIAWISWPSLDGQLHAGHLLLSVLGALTLIVPWVGVTPLRRVRVPPPGPPRARVP